MPLTKSKGKEAFKANVREMIKANHPQKQALAAAYSIARKAKADGGKVEEYNKAAAKILRGNEDGLDRVYPSDKYDDNATRAAQNRIINRMNQTVPMPTYRQPPAPQGEHMAAGGISGAGDVTGYKERQAVHRTVGSGMLKSPVPGRTDKLPISVPSGSYIIPSDIVSGIGEGNSDAGNVILSKMFTSGPMGIKPIKGGKAGAKGRLKTGKVPKGAKISAFADGGAVEPVDVIAAGGEMVLTPDQVAAVGGGDVDRGHNILDKFVVHARKQIVKTMKNLPGPSK